ncbi:Purine permease [Quillaja saponaria]|uniref:Purine permease n=1 Tax=Quillaja saponaria TaxID=32244 RepID=A0AAD7VKV2_QUISA|nr:Purine permease [Quillaja saponaria]
MPMAARASGSFLGWQLLDGLLTAILLFPTYFFCKTFLTPLNLKLIITYIVLGFLSAADNLMYVKHYESATLLASSSLVFSALLGYLLVKNKVNASMINAIFIITPAMSIIELDSGSDRNGNIGDKQYYHRIPMGHFGFCSSWAHFCFRASFFEVTGRKVLPCFSGATSHGFFVCFHIHNYSGHC